MHQEKPALKMQGLPYSASIEQIIEFFTGYNIDMNSINIGKYPDGKATG
jgi:hypothetical protein